MNPEYDYVLFTDADCERFMCELADPDSRRAYEAREHEASRLVKQVVEHVAVSGSQIRP
jgi:hypothetical protein